MESLISVLVPVFNAAPFLRRCVDSILSQNYINFELIILDDGSTDNSLDVARQYPDSRIRVYSQPHSGIAETRNRLLRLASGHYIYYVDADDWIEPDALKTLHGYAQLHDLDILICGHVEQTFPSTLNFSESDIIAINRTQAVERFLTSMDIPSAMWSKLIKTATIRPLAFDPCVHYGEDTLMTWCLINNARRIGLTNYRPYHYTDNARSITNSPFSDGTYSLRYAWDTIVSQTSISWPSLTIAARRKQLFCYFWLLYTALRSNIGADIRINSLRTSLKAERPLWNATLTSAKQRIFAWWAVYAYTPFRLILAPVRHKMPPLR